MSYAIIRNTKYKRDNLKGIFRHNERRNKNYSNDNIDKEKSYLNYSLKKPKYSYEKEFDRIREEYNLKGQIKTVSNVACEYIITSDKEFFKRIGESETKRYFEVAYQFVCEYKDLGEQYILSAKVHMDEQSPHMHLVFLPIVHTKDKKGNNIDKLACSEFWKEKDSYRQLQNAFYDYMVSYNFELERGLPKEETGRQHIDLKEYKEITNFKNTKETLKNIKLELPEVPDIKDIRKVMINRDEKICNEIIKPKDELIQELYQDNVSLYKELSKQAKVIEEAEKYQNERDKILADNEELHNTVKHLEKEYKKKNNNLEFDFKNRKDELEEEYKEKSFELEHKYHNKIHKLEKENNHLHKIINKFWDTLEKFISWICKKFDIAEEDNLVRDFQKETNTFIDPEKQIKKEERETLYEGRLRCLESMFYQYGEEYILPMGEESFTSLDDPDDWYGGGRVSAGIVINVNGTYIVDGAYKFDTIDELLQWAKVEYPEFMSDEKNVIKLKTIKNVSIQQLEDMFDGKKIEKEELSKRERFEQALLRDDVVDYFLEKSPEELAAFFGPDVARMVGFEQNNPHHCYDLFEHTLNTVEGIDTEGLSQEDATKLKVAAFFHDIGKPEVAMVKGDKTVFYNHAKKSAETSRAILGALDYTPEEIAQIQFYIEHHDDFINFKREDENWNRKNRFLRGIGLETVARKIQETKEDISIYGGYNPSKKDYQMLLRLCKADANAQSRIVREFGKVTDSRANKVSRLSQVEELVPEAYELALENTAEAIKLMNRFGPKVEATLDAHISKKVTHSMPGLFGDGREKVVIDEDIRQYEQELREAYLRDGGPLGEACKAKTAELFARGMTKEQFARISKILAIENKNRMIGGIDEIHKSGRLTKLFDVKKSLTARNLDAEKLLQQYEDRLRREGISQDK